MTDFSVTLECVFVSCAVFKIIKHFIVMCAILIHSSFNKNDIFCLVTEVPLILFDRLIGWFMVFNATFNLISAISWRSVLLVEETGVPGENS